MNMKKRYDSYSNTILDVDGDSRLRKSIFVSIVSYKDPNIVRTVDSLFLNAKRSENVFVSIAVTDIQPDQQPWVIELMSRSESNKNIRLNIININKNITFGKLKKMSESEYNKEDYYLSVSSRSEFDPHWDDILIKQYDTINNILDNDVILTCEPRGYLPHDDIVNGFVYYTNHKTRVSMQREEYDGGRIPISGYNEFISMSNISIDGSMADEGADPNDFLIQKESVKSCEKFLSQYNIVEFNTRKFIKDEYIALATGVSNKFMFCGSRLYFKVNPADVTLLDEIQFNFYSFINLVRNDVSILSLRFIPVYYLHKDGSSFATPEYSPANLYDEEEYKNCEGLYLIDRSMKKYLYADNKLNELLSVDWGEKKFKVRETVITNPIINAINIFVSLYNFSTYENSLHWNKRC
jgi:hypothetical protein